jgi:hypothetical protein
VYRAAGRGVNVFYVLTPEPAAVIIPASLPARAYSPEAGGRPAGFQNLSKPFTRPEHRFRPGAADKPP